MKINYCMRCWLLAVGIAALLCWLPHSLSAQDGEPVAGQPKIAPSLRAELAAATDISFLVILNEQLDSAAAVQAAGVGEADALTRRAVLYSALTAHAQRTQAPLRAWLETHGIDY